MKKTKQKIKFILVSFILVIATYSYSQVDYTLINPESTISKPDSIGINYYDLDLNDDDTTDYKIGARFFLSNEGPHPPYNAYEVIIWSTGENALDTGPFIENDTIDSSNTFRLTDVILGRIPVHGNIGAWSVKDGNFNIYRFIGLKLKKNNQFYYGWLKIKATESSFTIRSYAINETAGQAIVISEPN